MNEASHDDIFAGARITPDGNTGAWDDSYRAVTRIEIPKHVYWFTPEYRFHENGYDFWVVIHFFGFIMRSAAGTKMGEERETFTASQGASAKRRIIEYYSGPEDKIVVPFTMREARFLGVIFDDGWILLKN
jgi:hypothetical protein